MSIKLYNAYHLDVSSFDDLYTKVREFKASLSSRLIALQVEMIVQRAVRLHDAFRMGSSAGADDFRGLRKELWEAQNILLPQRQALALSEVSDTHREDTILSLVLALHTMLSGTHRDDVSFLFNAYLDVMSSVLNTDLSARRCSPCFESEIVVFKHGSDFYGILYSDNRDIVDSFLALEWVKDFSYYDNVDQPEDVPAQEFRRRGMVWNAILGNTHNLNDGGVTFGITSSSGMPGLLSIEKEIASEVAKVPGVADRARDYVLDQRTLKLCKELSANGLGFFTALRQARKEAQAQDLSEDIERISGMLTEISIESLKASAARDK